MKRIRCLPALAAMAGISLTLMTATSAGAAPAVAKPVARADSPVVRAFVKAVGAQVIRNQNALSLYRAWMLTQPGFARSGYVGSIDHLARKATTIMWAGPRTQLLAAIIAEGQRRGIKVSVQHRAQSLRQLSAAIAAIRRQAARGDWRGFTISAIAAVGAKDTGLTVRGTYTGVPARERAPQVKALHAVVLGVPVRVVPGFPAAPAIGRDTDSAPFDAGGLMASPSTNGICTSGFAINYGGATHTTTARHCTAPDYQAALGTAKYGTSVTNSSDGGGKVLSATGIAEAWDGAWNSENFAKVVIGFEDLGVNDLVCTGGGNSGEHCNVKVTNLLVSWNDGFGSFNNIEAVQQTANAIAVIQGDSGGPVISLAGTSSGQVRAAGMIQAVGGTTHSGTSCGSVFSYGPSNHPNLCSATVLFSSMRTIVNHLSGASLLTL
jgi:hypothetical protein